MPSRGSGRRSDRSAGTYALRQTLRPRAEEGPARPVWTTKTQEFPPQCRNAGYLVKMTVFASEQFLHC